MSGVRGQRIIMICRGCGAERQTPAGVARSRAKLAKPGRIIIDWERGTGVLTCGPCNSSALGTVRIARIKKRGPEAFKEHLGRMRAAKPATRPPSRAGATLTDHQRARLKLSTLALPCPDPISLCALCGRLLRTRASDAAKGGAAVGKFHGACLRIWRTSPDMKAWWVAGRTVRGRVGPLPPMPMPPRAADRQSSPDELAEAYITTVRYFWQREGSKRADRDEYSRVRPMSWLAADLGITRQALRLRVQRFLSLLPEIDVAGPGEQLWRAVFLTLNREKKPPEIEAAENACQVAQPSA